MRLSRDLAATNEESVDYFALLNDPLKYATYAAEASVQAEASLQLVQFRMPNHLVARAMYWEFQGHRVPGTQYLSPNTYLRLCFGFFGAGPGFLGSRSRPSSRPIFLRNGRSPSGRPVRS